MKNQVTTIEQSQRLVALGVPAEKASMMWFRRKISPTKWGDWELILGNGMSITRTESNEVAPAYTVADLLAMLPYYIEMDNDILSDFTWLRLGKGITKFEFRLKRLFPELWEVGYISTGEGKINGLLEEARRGDNLTTLCCEIIEWLLSNGYELEV